MKKGMKIVLLAVMACCMLLALPSIGHMEEARYVWAYQGEVAYFEENGLIGLLDIDGNMLIEARFTRVAPFRYDYAQVWENERLGAISKDGEVVIEPQEWLDFSINERESGTIVVYTDSNRKMGMKYLDGKTISEAQWDSILLGKNALVKKENLWTTIDMSGNPIWKNSYKRVKYGNDAFDVLENTSGYFGVINSQGEEIIPFEWDLILVVKDCYIVRREGKDGLLDSQGNVILQPEWDTLSLFKEEDLLVAAKDGKYGFVNLKGEIVIPLQWDYAYGHSMGLAKVELNGLTGFINTKGEYVIPLQDLWCSPYFKENGVLEYNTENTWGYIDLQGTKLCEVDYDVYYGEEYLRNGLIPVIQNSKIGYMDVYGNMVLPFQWDVGHYFTYGHTFVGIRGASSNSKYALINTKGEHITDYIWSSGGNFELFGDQVIAKVRVYTEEGQRLEGYIKTDGEVICGIKK